MYEDERMKILRDHARSPRCISGLNNKTEKYSWKNYLKPEVSDHYRYVQVSGRKESRRQQRMTSSDEFRRRSRSRVQAATTTSDLQRCTSQKEFYNIFSSLARSKNTEMTGGESEQERQMFESRLTGGRKSVQYEKLDLYHLQLKEEERLYLLKKFMEHYENRHGYKL